MAGVVIPIQSTDAGKEQVRQQLDNLGSQMSQLVQSYNTLRADVEGKMAESAVRDQLRSIMEQRKAAISALVASFKASAQNAAAQSIPTNSNIPALAGLGADSLTGLQTAVATEQSKLTALATYYQQAQAAIAAGQQPPPLPTELQSGSILGMSTTTLLLIGGAVLLFMMMKK